MKAGKRKEFKMTRVADSGDSLGASVILSSECNNSCCFCNARLGSSASLACFIPQHFMKKVLVYVPTG